MDIKVNSFAEGAYPLRKRIAKLISATVSYRCRVSNKYNQIFQIFFISIAEK